MTAIHAASIRYEHGRFIGIYDLNGQKLSGDRLVDAIEEVMESVFKGESVKARIIVYEEKTHDASPSQH